MKAILTGGSGFIASHIADRLIDNGYEVIAIDRTESNNSPNIEHLFDKSGFKYVKSDISNSEKLIELSKDADIIYHLAANSDIKLGGQNPDIDFNNTFLTTRSVLEAMRVNKIENMFFSSTSAVYGDKPGIRMTEDTGDLRPISYYGASKLASEALISAYSYMSSFNSLVFRFPNVVGPRLTHGVIFDFINKLKDNPKSLEILGNGKQSKQYVYVEDLADAIVQFSKKMPTGMDIFNISTESFTTVNEIADLVCEGMGLKDVEYKYTGGSCGWKGDVPSFDYCIDKAKSNGWTFKYDSTGSVRKTIECVL